MKKSVACNLAGAVALAGSTQAYGQIVPITPPDNLNGHPEGVGSDVTKYYDVSTGVTSDTLQVGDDFRFSYHNSSNYFLTQVNGINPTDQVASTYVGAYLYANAITAGTTIGSDTMQFNQTQNPATFLYTAYLTVTFNPTNSTLSLQQPNTDTFLGFQFTSTVDSLVHNGYLELESVPYTSPSSPGGLIFLGGAYNSLPDSAPDGAGDITAEAIPEPGTISSLVLGAAALGGVGLLRRRRSFLA